MASCHHWPVEDDDPLDEEGALVFWRLPRAFSGKRHTEKIEAFKTVAQTWRMRERMKTVSVALVLCLNVGVDPPDVVKISPCARLQCWIDPLQYSDPTAANNQKAVEIVGANLQRQYERWQPRARYKLSLDPTIDEVKKLCISLRRNAKDERVLFHYNGHGVPRPTQNGEIWVFNKHFTQYIPLSVCDLQMWMGTPSIYVFDCSNAGTIVNFLKATPVPQQFTENELSETVLAADDCSDQTGSTDLLDPSNSCIQLAACASNEILPMNPELPADLFTSCLTTPIKIALQWYVLQKTSKLVPGITLDLVDKMPGQLNDRRTMLGELNWIFTAITDTIAWNILPRELFQKLFRQDLLVASLFRNYLLAERIMRSYNCSPVSMPKLPPTFQHPMWQAWDLAMDSCLSQLIDILNDPSSFKNSSFFAEQLTGFQVWLTYGSDKRSPPEQLPIVLQVLLSQVHRQRALELLGRFLDLGPWAVNLSLSVGIFPYVLKLLQSSARELRPLLVFIWAKLLAVDSSCQTDLVKDNGHKYFLAILSDQYMPADHRMMAAFVLTMIVNNYPTGQEVALQGNLIALCLEHLGDKHSLLKQWLALCLGKVWTNYDAARWCGVRDSAHEKLYPLLSDSVPEVRAAAVFALGTFINNSTERDEQINNIDHGIATKLLTVLHDGSVIVRKELVVALSGLVMQFESQFTSVAYQFAEEESAREYHTVTGTIGVFNSPNEAALFPGMRRSASTRCLKGMLSPVGVGADAFEQTPGGTFKRIASTSSVMSSNIIGYGNVYSNVWKAFLYLSNDASSSVAELAKRLITHVKHKVMATTIPKSAVMRQRKVSAPGSGSGSAPSSPSNRPGSFMPSRTSESTETQRPNTLKLDHLPTLQRTQNNIQYMQSRRLTTVESISEREDDISSHQFTISTEFFEWCCKYFTESMLHRLEEHDPEGPIAQERDYRYTRAARAQRLATEERTKTKIGRLDDPVFMNRNLGIPSILRFHPYESHLVVGDKDHICVWDWEQSSKLHSFSNRNPRHTRITYTEFINSHDRALLVTGSDDGGVRIWRNYSAEDNCQTELVTAWQALSDMLPTSKGSGIVMDWEQTSGSLYTSGDVRFVRIWDVQTELKVQDLPTNADSCITSLSLDRQSKSVFVGGCGDGNVRVFDRRLPPSDCVVKVFREHPTWVVKAYTLQNFPNRVVSASTQGDIRLWDLRKNESLKTINTQQGLTAVDAHQYSELLACGSVQQFVAVYSHNGEAISTIKYHEGFMGQRIGQVTCLAFHPLKVKLAVGSTDQFVNVYSSADSRKK